MCGSIEEVLRLPHILVYSHAPSGWFKSRLRDFLWLCCADRHPSDHSFSMDLRGHDAFLSVDESGIFDEAEHDFSFSHTPPDGVPHNSQGMPYGYTDVSGLSGPVNPARDRSGYQDFTKPTEPRPTNRGAVEPRTKAQPARDTLRATQAGSQQLLKDGLRNVRRLQDLEHRLTQRVSGLEGRLSGLENR